MAVATDSLPLGLWLNLACGRTTWEGFENSDVSAWPEAEHMTYYVNLDEPLPYEDGSVALAMISHGLCLRPDKPAVLSEFARVLCRGGWLRIDDNPYRFPAGDVNPDNEDMPPGVDPFPAAMRMPRAELLDTLRHLGFWASDVYPLQTLIPAEGCLREALIGNHSAHGQTFTVEGQRL